MCLLFVLSNVIYLRMVFSEDIVDAVGDKVIDGCGRIQAGEPRAGAEAQVVAVDAFEEGLAFKGDELGALLDAGDGDGRWHDEQEGPVGDEDLVFGEVLEPFDGGADLSLQLGALVCIGRLGVAVADDDVVFREPLADHGAVLDAVGDEGERGDVGVCAGADAGVDELTDRCLGRLGGEDDLVALVLEFVGDAAGDRGFSGAIDAFEGDK